MAPGRPMATNTNQLRNASVLSSANSPQLPFNGINGPRVANPPPLPPRQAVQSYDFGSTHYPGYNNYLSSSNYYRGYGGNNFFGGYSPYSSVSSYNNYGYYGGPSGDVESRIVQYAEESTRPTFQVIENVLQTFSSITMMLDSTYFALNNSFKAILSVAESMSRLRSTFSQLLSTFALIRFLRWLYRRLRSTVGLRNNDSNEELWQGSLEEVNASRPTSSSWNGLVILGALAVIPYLIHKLLNNAKQFQAKRMDPKEWAKIGEPIYGATAQYDFVARSNDELSLKAGQKVWIAPQSLQPRNMPGWWRATDTVNVGLIPSNYVTIVGQMKNTADARASRDEVSQLHTLPEQANENIEVTSSTPKDNTAVGMSASESPSAPEAGSSQVTENVDLPDARETKTKESMIELSSEHNTFV